MPKRQAKPTQISRLLDSDLARLITLCWIYYRGYSSVIDASLTDNDNELLAGWWDEPQVIGGMFGSVLLCRKNAGFWGDGILKESLLSMRSIFCIFGLISGSSWTQSNPIWIHLITSLLEHESLRFTSSNSNGVPSLQCLQTCKKKIRLIQMLQQKCFQIELTKKCTSQSSTYTHMAQEVFAIVWVIEISVLLASYNL